MVLTALVISRCPGSQRRREARRDRSASANQKNATQSPLPASKKKCCPAPHGQVERLINGIPRMLV
jgi:hypothetical protein